ncbi:MAG: hypothetical protein FJY29_08435 [Betaproteobacteria bacterium]|nr:hypothetical protein [Betaproteobacteria bacterium]
MSAAASALVPLAMFLINESTRDVFVMPGEAAARIEGAKPCASIRINVVATEFTPATLDQMCVLLAQGMLSRVNGVVKTTWSSEHAAKVGGMIQGLSGFGHLRNEAQVWPPEVPFSVVGLNQPTGVSVVFGVKALEKRPVQLERVDAWAQVDGRFLRSYWSRSIHDPAYYAPISKALQRIGTSFQRAWRAPTSPALKQDALRILVDKRISERELATLESVVKSLSKGAADTQLIPIDVRKDGILYQTQVPKPKVQDVIARFGKDLPALKAQSLGEGAVDISLMVAAPK